MASWQVKFPQTGTFEVNASLASLSGASEFVIEIAGRKIPGTAAKTSGWDRFKEISLGRIEVIQSGAQVVSLRPKDARNWKAMNLRFVKLMKVE